MSDYRPRTLFSPKKRKLDSLPARLARVEKRVSRATPDKQYVFYANSTATTNTIGLHQFAIDLGGAATTALVSGDYYIESIDFYARPTTGTGSGDLDEVRVMSLTAKASNYAGGGLLTDVGGFTNPKQVRVHGDQLWHFLPAQGTKIGARSMNKVGLVASHSGATYMKNQPWLFVAYNQTTTNPVSLIYRVRLTIREK